MWTRAFWVDTFERAVKTFAQAAVAAFGGNVVGVLDMDWVAVGSLAAAAAVVSILTSVASAPLSQPGTASLTREVNYR